MWKYVVLGIGLCVAVVVFVRVLIEGARLMAAIEEATKYTTPWG